MRLRVWGTRTRLESITRRSGESLKVEVQEVLGSLDLEFLWKKACFQR